MRSRQSGITFVGWLVLLVPLAIVFFAGIKLAPIYMNHFKVAKALEQTASESGSVVGISAMDMRRGLERRFDIEGIENPSLDSIQIKREDGEWVIIAEYDRETTLMGNVALTVHFNKRVLVK